MRSLPLALLALFAACSAAKPEAASLVAAVDRFHRASNDDRPARSDAVAAVVCEDKEVCAAKTACVEATSATAAALRLKAEVAAALREVEQGHASSADPAMAALTTKLDEASKLLEKGHAAMPDCDRKILALRGRYGL